MNATKPCVAGALLVALVGIGLRVLLAPVRWAESLTEQPAEEDTLAYVWWRDDEDRDDWATLGVAEDVAVGHNGHGRAMRRI